MRITEIRLERLKSTRQFENERLGVTVEVAETESVVEAVQRARSFINRQLGIYEEQFDAEEIREAEEILRKVGRLEDPLVKKEF